MNKEKTKVYLYTRVSTVMQIDGYSLEAQKTKMKSFCDYNDYEIVGEYEDAGKSGKSTEGRVSFNQMIEDIKSGKDGISFVLVFKLSRFGRNAADVLSCLQVMQDYGVNLICVEDGIDSSKDAGKLMISVLSAVAEIERENIRVQTMEGRMQKAREGKWNGGFAPYGYELKEGKLYINEEEAIAIRTIFDKYVNTDMGANAIAKYLENHGISKIPRQNGKNPLFDASLIRKIIHNPVYCGKIAFGRRRTEKVQGTRNDYHLVKKDDYILVEGLHEAIVTEEDWNLAQEKSKKNAFVREKVRDLNHAHVLSGIVRCPDCGKGLYGNISTPHKKDNKIRHYYYCKNTVKVTGHKCKFRTNIDQEEINRQVFAVISAMVSQPEFIDAIKKKISSTIDTSEMEKKKETLDARRQQAEGTKNRLEKQMDTLDINDPFYEQKIADFQRRYDEQYSIIAEIDKQQTEINEQLYTIRQEKLTGDQVYQLLLAFNQLYPTFPEIQQKRFMKAFIERVDLYPKKTKDGIWIRSITFNFPVPVDGNEVVELPLESQRLAETVALLTR